MLFSVLMSVYKNEKPLFLNDCLDSLFKQTLPANELIIVIDGQISEELHLVINKWVDLLPIKLISLEKNVGLGNALNIGMRKCTYDIILRMDTDDICQPTRFEKQINFMAINSDVALLGSASTEYNETMDTIIGRRKIPITHDEIKKYIKKRNPFNHMTIAFRKKTVLSAGGYQHHLYMEDYNLWIRLISLGNKTANIDQSLVNVRSGMSMLKRRKGILYIKSEYQLAMLKINNNIDTPLSAIYIFIIRGLPRLLPTFFYH